MPNTLPKSEQRLLNRILQSNAQIRAVYEEAIQEITLTASRYTYKGKVFNLDDYPLLKKKIEARLQEMHASIYAVIVNSIKDAWNFSNQNNNVLVDKRLAGKVPTSRLRRILYDPNKGAMKQFISRREKGLNLSSRIWKSLDPFKMELEQGLGLGISEGKPAAKMATELKRYLDEPDRLFRRVRDEKGKLRLSKRAREYKPGKGKYRSSYKNSLRLTASETNIAYRSADHERWKNMPFVIGIEVRLSDSHPKFDICDHLVGEYPKDYKHIGFHPKCLCFAVPKLCSNEDYSKIEDFVLGLVKTMPEIKAVKEIPAAAKEWMKGNAERIAGWKSMPYFVRDNGKYLGGFFD